MVKDKSIIDKIVEDLRARPNQDKQTLLLTIARKMGLRYEDMEDKSPSSTYARYMADAGQYIPMLIKDGYIQAVGNKYIAGSVKPQTPDTQTKTEPAQKDNKPQIQVQNKPKEKAKPEQLRVQSPQKKTEPIAIKQSQQKAIKQPAPTQKNVQIQKPALPQQKPSQQQKPVQQKPVVVREQNKKPKKIERQPKSFESINQEIAKLHTKVLDAQAKYNERLEDGLLLCIAECDTKFFEKLCVELVARIYASNDFAVQGGVNDGGVDGIVRVWNDLGYREEICIQAKCRESLVKMSTENEVSMFYGKVRENTKAVFMTNGKFHAKAVEYAKDRKNLRLIDGVTMAKLMVKYGIGVKQSDGLHIIDKDYFPFGK